MAGHEPFDTTVLRVAQLVKQFVADVRDASVSLVEQDSARTVVFTGALAMELDEAQYDDRSGPCLDAARSGRTIVVINSSSGSAYPTFSEMARSRDVLQTVSIGLSAPGTVSAGLNIYARHDQPFDDDAMSRAGTLANYARAAVAQLATSDSPAEVRGLYEAISSRALVDRAAVVLTDRHGYSRDQALSELLDRSRDQRRPLADVAQALVTS
jgi:transcriptional regulator with GAF, ATPase, and Fis domain